MERQKLKDRPRKILNLEERVQAIRMYDELPVYQRVASAFKCSWEQIKNVVANRHQILKYYASCQIIDLAKDDPKVVRHKKINFLGNCMYEYIKRAQYHEQQNINDDVIRSRAKEFKEIINIEKFFPNSAWIRDFKSVFNIDLEHMSEIMVSGKPQKSLNCKDIITYCAKEVDSALSAQSGNAQSQLVGDNSDFNSIERSDHDEFIHHLGFEYDEVRPDFDEDMINEDEEGPTIDFGSYGDDQDDETDKKVQEEEEERDIKPDVSILEDILKNQSRTSMLVADKIKDEPVDDHVSAEVSMKSPSESSSQTKEAVPSSIKRRAGSPITTYSEALAFMRPLEDFAICEEDFKAINLLTQLAEVYEKAKKRRLK